MNEIKTEWRISGFTETEIRGDEKIPVYVSEPRWTLKPMPHTSFTSIVHNGKHRVTFPFKSDDIEIALEIINDGGEEKEIAKALATNIAFVTPLIKHCDKLIKRGKKIRKIKKNSTVIVKKSYTKKVKSDSKNNLTVDLNKNLKITLNQFI